MDVYMYFDGNANEALEFYSKVFEVEKNEIMTYRDLPVDPQFEIPEEQKKLILNTDLVIDGTTVMFSDLIPSMSSEPLNRGNNINFIINSDSKEYIKNLFDRLKEDGKVTEELGETFWTELYGTVRDKFGNIWGLNYSDE